MTEDLYTADQVRATLAAERERCAKLLTPARCEYCTGSGEVFGKDGPTICPYCDGRGHAA